MNSNMKRKPALDELNIEKYAFSPNFKFTVLHRQTTDFNKSKSFVSFVKECFVIFWFGNKFVMSHA